MAMNRIAKQPTLIFGRLGPAALPLALALVVFFSAVAPAQEAPTPTAAPTTQPAPQDPLASPRSAVETFLLAMQEKRIEQAVACLDLSRISKDQRGKTGPERAQLLQDLIDHRFPQQLKLEAIPDEPNHADPGHPEGTHVFAFTETTDDEGRPKGEIVLARGDDGHWRFSSNTVAAIPELYKPLRTRPAPTSQPAPETGVPPQLSSAQATAETFVEAMKASKENPQLLAEAIDCLDLSKIESTNRAELGPERAKLLYLVIKGKIGYYGAIPNDPQGKPYDVLGDGKVVIKRQPDGRWLFTAQTVEKIPLLAVEARKKGKEPEDETVAEITRELSAKLWLEAHIPESFRGEFLAVQYWHWIALLMLILVGVAADQIAVAACRTIVDAIARHRELRLDREVRTTALRPIGFLVMGLLWWNGLGLLSLSFPHAPYAILSAAVKIITGTAGVWAIYRLIDLLGGYLAAAAEKTGTRYDDLLVPLVRKTLKIAVTVVGFVFVAEVFNLPVKTLLTSLGIGGLAIGFAARETLQNFFGSITVLIDRPFHIGDWVKVGDVEGTVETVGFRSTRVRTFYNSLITMPNGTLLTATVDNLGARRYRRIKAMLSVTYDTPPEKIDAFCEGIRELIRRHPYTRKDYYHVYFNQFADASLNVLLYCFYETPDWATELRERHRLFNDILRLAERLGVEFAFPTQTIHLHQEPTRSPDHVPPPPSGDPIKAGRKAAAAIVRESGLAGTIPPPAGFDPIESRGEDADADD